MTIEISIDGLQVDFRVALQCKIYLKLRVQICIEEIKKS